MKSKIFLQLIILCFSCFWQTAEAAETIGRSEAVAWVEDKGQLLLKTFSKSDLQTKYRELDNLFLNYVDLDYIGKFVVGKYWRQMTPEQREKYLPLFKRYSMAIYKSFPLNFSFRISFKITDVKLEADYADVTALIDLDPEVQNIQDKKTFLVGFRLRKIAGTLKIIDLKLAESSLILSYRNRFYEMIHNNDDEIEWFLEDLEMTTVSTEETNQMRLRSEIQ